MIIMQINNLALIIFLRLSLCAGLTLRRLSRQVAMSEAIDVINLSINETVARIMKEQNYPADYFIKLEKDGEANITAVTTDTTRVNAFSALVLSESIRSADSRKLEVSIPLGNLTGSSLLLGRGPEVPVEIIMLTSSFVSFQNELTSTGINQSKHRITLQANVDIDILIPWVTVSTTICTEIPIAETIIIGRVPQTYVHVTEDTYGSK